MDPSVSLHDGLVNPFHITHGKAVHDDVSGVDPECSHGTVHGESRGPEDVERVDLSHGGSTDPDRRRSVGDPLVQLLSRPRGEPFGVRRAVDTAL